jgi:hypothetical protein
MTCLIVVADYNIQTSRSGIQEMIMARVMLIVINYEMVVNRFATNLVKTVQIHCW